MSIDGQVVGQHAAIKLQASQAVELINGDQTAGFLLLQGRPIGDPMAQHGPFVMNTRPELQQAYDDDSRTPFGGWPFADDAPVHGPKRVRFARHADGRVEPRPWQAD